MNKTNLNKIGLTSVGVLLAIIFVSSLGVGSASAAITSNLGVGSKGAQVSELQGFLATNPLVYPQALVTGYFGGLTQVAVEQFQMAYGIPTVGTVGPITRAKINNIQANGLGIDLSAPVMTTPSVQVNSTGATISWTNNEMARGKVIYGTSPVILGNTSDATGVNFVEPSVVSGVVAPFDMTPRFNQSITINNLIPNTTYYYRVMALDASNNVSLSLPGTFNTTQ